MAEACREGARAAVREVILELIANPELLSAVRATAAPAPAADDPSPAAPPPAPSLWGRVKNQARDACRAAAGAARTLVKSVEGAARPAADALKLAGPTRAVLAAAAGVGLAFGLVSLACPAWACAALTALAGAATVVAAHVGAVVNSFFARLRPAD